MAARIPWITLYSVRVERGSLSCKRSGKCRVYTREEKSHTVARQPVRNFDILSATIFPRRPTVLTGATFSGSFVVITPRSQPLS